MEHIIMNKPKDCTSFPFYFVLDECKKAVSHGDMVLYKFYNQGIWKENHIPNELKKNNWIPNTEQLYKIWYHHTNPSDPSDSGYDVLDYIEEVKGVTINSSSKPKLVLSLTPLEVKRLIKYINNHPDEYIDFYYSSDIKDTHYLGISTRNSNENTEITDNNF